MEDMRGNAHSGLSENIGNHAGRKVSKILFIDDNSLVLQTIERLLENTAYELVSAENAFEGLCALAEHKPVGIFIDANTLRLDGFQFCTLVKNQLRYQHIPLVIVLGQRDDMEQAKAKAAGADAVLVKPFGKHELLGLMKNPQANAA